MEIFSIIVVAALLGLACLADSPRKSPQDFSQIVADFPGAIPVKEIIVPPGARIIVHSYKDGGQGWAGQFYVEADAESGQLYAGCDTQDGRSGAKREDSLHVNGDRLGRNDRTCISAEDDLILLSTSESTVRRIRVRTHN